LLAGDFNDGDTVLVDVDENHELVLRKAEDEDEPEPLAAANG